jgi:hydroxymethylglutaryl-CoA lyase
LHTTWISGTLEGVEPERVQIVEVGPRDGLQNEAAVVPTDRKVDYLEALVTAGHTRIEAVSFVHPDRVPQMADAEDVMRRAPRRPGVSYAGLVLNSRGLRRAVDAGVDEINVVVVASETFSRRNQGAGIEESLEITEQILADADSAGLYATVTVAAAFGCPFEGEVPVQRVVDIVERVGHAAAEVALADTIGVAVPVDVTERVSAVRAVTSAPLRCHLHNTRNTGYANALAAVQAGVSALDASSGGIGGCPFAPRATGNIATEDLQYLLARSGLDTGLRLADLLAPAALVCELIGSQPPGQLRLAGDFPPDRLRND